MLIWLKCPFYSKNLLITTVFYTESNSRPVRTHLHSEAEVSAGNINRITNSKIIPTPLRFLTWTNSWQRLSIISSLKQFDLHLRAPYLKGDLVNDQLTISKHWGKWQQEIEISFASQICHTQTIGHSFKWFFLTYFLFLFFYMWHWQQEVRAFLSYEHSPKKRLSVLFLKANVHVVSAKSLMLVLDTFLLLCQTDQLLAFTKQLWFTEYVSRTNFDFPGSTLHWSMKETVEKITLDKHTNLASL